MKKVILLLFLIISSCSKEEINKLEETNLELTIQVALLKSQIQDLTTTVLSLELDNNQLSTLNGNLTNQITNLQSAIVQVENDYMELMSEYSQVINENEQLYIDYLDLQNRLKELEEFLFGPIYHEGCEHTQFDYFSNWHSGEPNFEHEKVVFIDNMGKWYDHHNSLNNSGFGIYEVHQLTNYIGNNYVYLGQYKGHSYFRTKDIISIGNHIEIIRDNTGKRIGSLVVFNSMNENNIVANMINISPPPSIPVGHG